MSRSGTEERARVGGEDSTRTSGIGGFFGEFFKKSSKLPSRYTVWRPPLGGNVVRWKEFHIFRSCLVFNAPCFWFAFKTFFQGTIWYVDRTENAAEQVTCVVTPLSWFSCLRGLFSEQLDDLGGRTLRWKKAEFQLISPGIYQGNLFQPHALHIQNIWWTKRRLGVKDCGNHGGEFKLQAKTPICNLLIMNSATSWTWCRSLFVGVFLSELAQAGHSTSSEWRAVGGKHQWLLQRPGQISPESY